MKKKMIEMDTRATVVAVGDRVEIANNIYVVIALAEAPNTNFIKFVLQLEDKPMAFVELWMPRNYYMRVYPPAEKD